MSDGCDKTGIDKWSRFWLDRSEFERDAHINLVQVERKRRCAAAAAEQVEVALDLRGAVDKFIKDCCGPIVAAKVRALCLLHAPTACVSQVILALNKTCDLEHFNIVMMSQAGFIFSRDKYRIALVRVLACACLCLLVRDPRCVCCRHTSGIDTIPHSHHTRTLSAILSGNMY